MTDEMMLNSTITNFITAAHLTEVKRRHYELDLINEYSGERYVFMIPRDILNMTIMNKRVMKPVVIKVKRDESNNEPPAGLTI